MWHVNVSPQLFLRSLQCLGREADIFQQCCNPEINGGGGWGVFNALLGWQNSATYGSVISYNVYWIVVIAGFLALRYHENNGHWPLMQAKEKKQADGEANSVESPVIEHASKEGTTQVRSLAI